MKEPNSNVPPEVRRTSIGGQALIEGLMMIGPHKTAMAVRLPDHSIKLEEQPTKKFGSLARVPFVRGFIRLVGQLAVGMKALTRSADLAEEHALDESPEPANEAPTRDGETAELVVDEATQFETDTAEHSEADPLLTSTKSTKTQGNKLDGALIVLTALVSVLISVGIFILLPNYLTTFILNLAGLVKGSGFSGSFVYNLVEGMLRIMILLLYMWLASRSKDVARTWQYHGAEHKTIACYEADRALTVENVREFSRFHPRCGTSFLFFVVFLSVFIHSFFGWHDPWINMAIRIALIPVITGIAYELQRFAGARTNSRVGAIISAPGLLLQRLTTKEPDDDILEVSITAMNAVLPKEEGDAGW